MLKNLQENIYLQKIGEEMGNLNIAAIKMNQKEIPELENIYAHIYAYVCGCVCTCVRICVYL